MEIITPKIVFIVPYRNREEEKKLFISKMKALLIDLDESYYRIFFIHQCDEREFNRGALKNIGFLMVKKEYPNDYLSITLCFNDIDTYPVKTGLITDYTTTSRIIKHFYGYSFALGGIVSITCKDFEIINGFPNYWSWGFEDNLFNQRVLKRKLIIDRSVFFKIGDIQITQLNESTYERTVNEIEFRRYTQNIDEGIRSIINLSYVIDYVTGIVNVLEFDTGYTCKKEFNSIYDTRSNKPPFRIGYSAMKRCTMNLVF
jgi:hypothetical protein